MAYPDVVQTVPPVVPPTVIPTPTPPASAVVVGGAAPATPKAGDLWFENTVFPPVLHVYTGSRWEGFNANTSGTNMKFVGPWSTHGPAPTTMVKGDVYIARDDANAGGLDPTWNSAWKTMAKAGDLLVFTDPEWHVFSTR